jgi:hypothetical protein
MTVRKIHRKIAQRCTAVAVTLSPLTPLQRHKREVKDSPRIDIVCNEKMDGRRRKGTKWKGRNAVSDSERT